MENIFQTHVVGRRLDGTGFWWCVRQDLCNDYFGVRYFEACENVLQQTGEYICNYLPEFTCICPN